jgi:NAD(P)-dependent dehydrogenase (short-subunit alcohol dehydrogenase family)
MIKSLRSGINMQEDENAKAEIDRVAKGKVDLILADLSSIDEIRRLAKVLLDKYQKIHVLINNAGVQYNTRRTSVDGYEITFAVNYLALFLLTRLLLDRIKASAPARVKLPWKPYPAFTTSTLTAKTVTACRMYRRVRRSGRTHAARRRIAPPERRVRIRI